MLRTNPQDHDSAFQAFVEMGRRRRTKRINEVKEIQLFSSSHKGPIVAYLFINAENLNQWLWLAQWFRPFWKKKTFYRKRLEWKGQWSHTAYTPSPSKNFKFPYVIVNFKRNVMNFWISKNCQNICRKY